MRELDRLALNAELKIEAERRRQARAQQAREAEARARAAEDARDLDALIKSTLAAWQRAGAPGVRLLHRVPVRGMFGTRKRNVAGTRIGEREFEWKETTLTSFYYLTSLGKISPTAGLGGFVDAKSAAELSDAERALVRSGLQKLVDGLDSP